MSKHDNYEYPELQFTTADIDRRSDELIAECHKYQAEARALPGCNDRLAFESWAIQKISSLQLLIEQLNKRANLHGHFVDMLMPGGALNPDAE
jgi:hypothetical protein